MSIQTAKNESLTWVNIPQISDDVIAYLEKNYDFHELDIEDIQEQTQTPKLDVYKDYIFLVMQFPHWNSDKQRVGMHEMAVFLGDKYLITVQRGGSQEIQTFFSRCMESATIKEEWMAGSSSFLLYNILEAMFHNTQPILTRIGKELNMLEEEIYEDDHDTDTIRELARHRRNILNFRRLLDPQRYLISNLSHIRKPFMDQDIAIYIDDIHDFLNKLWSIVNSYKDTVNGLHITVESLINQRTNKVISALTVVSASLLPLTLLAGIYGMNITLPYSDRPMFVWGLFGLVGALIITIILVMKKKHWI
jgi:magnesium transporter